LDANLLPFALTEVQDEEIAGDLRKLRIEEKLDAVCKLATGVSFNCFLSSRPNVLSSVRCSHPQLGESAKKFFHEELFLKRNKILHLGKLDFGKPEAEACFTVAATLLGILNEMHREKYAKFTAEQRRMLDADAQRLV
jgi:hypothetical protein